MIQNKIKYAGAVCPSLTKEKNYEYGILNKFHLCWTHIRCSDQRCSCDNNLSTKTVERLKELLEELIEDHGEGKEIFFAYQVHDRSDSVLAVPIGDCEEVRAKYSSYFQRLQVGEDGNEEILVLKED